MRSKNQSEAQRERQRNRDTTTGKYVKNPCQGCGLAAPVFNYFSHFLTDQTDCNGENWGDKALVLCKRCSDATEDFKTVKEFRAFQENRAISAGKTSNLKKR